MIRIWWSSQMCSGRRSPWPSTMRWRRTRANRMSLRSVTNLRKVQSILLMSPDGRSKRGSSRTRRFKVRFLGQRGEVGA